MKSPPNISNRPEGYNKRMFPDDRSIRKGFMSLGYGISYDRHEVSPDVTLQFQRDYNKCSRKLSRWGAIEADGKLGKDTMNALEIAIRWAKKAQNEGTLPSSTLWQSFCRESPGCSGFPEDAEEPIDNAKYVEINSNGSAMLRDLYKDGSLRVELASFERHGDAVIAVVTVPPQANMPRGRSGFLKFPCVVNSN